METPPVKKVGWKIRRMMVEAGIHSASELKRQMDTFGLDITTSHTARIVNEIPNRLSIELLTALINVLHCTPGDLLVCEPVDGSDETFQDKEKKTPLAKKKEKKPVESSSTPRSRKKSAREKAIADDDTDFFGPTLQAIPNPYDGRT